jgi:glycosyltransferase involved in cell wall biosynthesis
MKILYVSAYKEDSGGGEGNITWELAHESAKFGNNCIMLSPNPNFDGFKKSKSKELDLYLYPSMDILGQLHLFSFTPNNILRLLKFLNEYQPDIIHYHTVVPIVLLLELWAIRNNKLVVNSIHENPDKMLTYTVVKSGSMMDMITKRIGFDAYLRTLYRHTDHMVSVNDLHNQPIRDFGYDGPLTTILNGRDLNRFYNLKIPNIKSKDINLFFVGFISERKNQKYLVEVMKYLPKNYHLNIIGSPIYKEYQESLPKLPNVHFLGQIPFDNLAKILEEQHIFVSASLEEAFSLVVIEALAAGKPVVGLENDTMNRLITKSNNNGVNLAQSTHPKEFAKEILKIQTLNQSQYVDLAKRARKSVEYLSWDRAMQQYQEVYKDILKSEKEFKDSQDIEYILFGFVNKRIIKNLYDRFDKGKNIVKLGAIVSVAALLLAGVATGFAVSKMVKKNK